MSLESSSASAGGATAGQQKRGRAIFISYRRDDSEGEAGRLYDDLVRAYGDASVFMDVSGIQPGVDFRAAIDDNIAACGVLLAVIGPNWATITGHDGARRLDNPADYVRLEIASALKRGIPVIPVLVHEAHMPALEQLPDDIKDLRYRNSVELTHARWSSDVPLLVAALKNYVDAKPARPEETVHATVPVQLPAPTPKPPKEERTGRLSVGVALGALAVVGVLAVLFFAVVRPRWEARHEAAAGNAIASPDATASPAVAPASSNAPNSPPPPTKMPAAANASPLPSAAANAAPSSTSAPASNASATAAVPVGMLGVWKIMAQNLPPTDNLQQLTIAEFGGQFTVQAFGSCPGRPCNWGTRRLVMSNGFAVSATPWELRNTDKERNLQRRVSLSMALNDGTLLVTVKNEMEDPSQGHKVNLHDVQLRKAN